MRLRIKKIENGTLGSFSLICGVDVARCWEYQKLRALDSIRNQLCITAGDQSIGLPMNDERWHFDLIQSTVGFPGDDSQQLGHKRFSLWQPLLS
jgi:hypothetical protein